MLRNDTLVLRAVEPEDLELMYLIENDTKLWSCGSATVPYSRFALRQYIESCSCDLYTDRALRLVMETKCGVAVGFIDLQNFDPRHLRAEVGVVVLSDYQHNGYASEALELLLEYASVHLHLHQLYAVIASENEYAMCLFRSKKFKPSGVLTEWLVDENGTYVDACILIRVLP